jgi:hypothetical protein
MDDWARFHSASPELDERLSYAAKIANLSAINSGQIDADPANVGSVSWTYQAMKGNVYRGSAETLNGATANLHNAWREMAGEADLGVWGAIRLLSADVAVDPVFGLVGYGCDVSTSNGCYAITPRDGVFKRLNLITEGLGMTLDRDRYSGATVSPSKNYVGFTLLSQTAAAHTTNLTLTGLAAGSYMITIDGAYAESVNATSGQPVVVPLSVASGSTHSVQVGSGCGGATTGTDAGSPPPGGSDAGSTNLMDGGSIVTGEPDATTAGTSSGGTSGGATGGTTTGGLGGHSSPGAGGSPGCGCSSVGFARADVRLGLLGMGAVVFALRRRRGRGTNGTLH